MRIADSKSRKAFIDLVMKSLGPLKPQIVYLFGTHGTEYERKDSDVDLAFLAEGPVDDGEKEGVVERLSDRLKKKVDLIDLQSAPTTLRCVILDEGDCLACLNTQLKDEFEMYTFSDYARLNEERKPILEELEKELE